MSSRSSWRAAAGRTSIVIGAPIAVATTEGIRPLRVPCDLPRGPLGPLLEARDNGYQDRIDAIDRQIDSLNRRLERREEFLVLQFTQLESSLAILQNQGNSLSALSNPNS